MTEEIERTLAEGTTRLMVRHEGQRVVLEVTLGNTRSTISLDAEGAVRLAGALLRHGRAAGA